MTNLFPYRRNLAYLNFNKVSATWNPCPCVVFTVSVIQAYNNNKITWTQEEKVCYIKEGSRDAPLTVASAGECLARPPSLCPVKLYVCCVMLSALPPTGSG